MPEQELKERSQSANPIRTILDTVYMHRLPSYGNTIFYGLGFLALTCLILLGISGIILAFMGQTWWLHAPLGIYTRSFHLWTVQAFIFILILHGLVGFSTSGFRKPRRFVWVIGATIFCLALIQTEFGYGLRGDFSSQFRAVSGADFWNGAFLGYFVNPLSHLQEFALHVAIIPLLIFVLFILHYILEHSRGIAKPYRKDIPYRVVAADHTVMYLRGAALVVLIAVMSFFFHSPYVKAVTIADVANQQPKLVATTLLQEFDRTSDTATYLDSIDPYTFDTRKVYVDIPYEQLVNVTGQPDALAAYDAEASSTRSAYLAQAKDYVSNGGALPVPPPAPVATSTATTTAMTATSTAEASVTASTTMATASMTATTTLAATSTPSPYDNPLLSVLGTLMPATENGLYQAIIDGEHPSINYTYSLRFLNDMDVLESTAGKYDFSTEQWGMAKDENGHWLLPLPPGSWWLTPLGAINSAFNLLSNDNGDRIGAEILGFLMIIAITFPFIPFVNRIPEVLHLAPFIWRREHKRDKTLPPEESA